MRLLAAPAVVLSACFFVMVSAANAGSDGVADLRVDLTASKERVREGTALTFVATVTNRGPDTAPRMLVGIHRPRGADPRALPDGCIDSVEITCRTAGLRPGHSRRFVVRLHVLPHKSYRHLTAHAHASSLAADPNHRNSKDADTVPVVQEGR